MQRLFRYIASLWKDLRTSNSFLQNSAWLFSASALGTLVQLIFFPIISRIYGPEAYGVFGLFNAIVVNVAIIAGLNLSMAFVLPKSIRKFAALLQINIRIALIICGVAALISLLFGKQLLSLFQAEELGNWVYLIAPAAFLVAFDKILIDWATRIKAFKKFALYNFQTNLISKLFNLGYGWKISNGASGLILTNVLSFSLRIFVYLKFILGKKRNLAFAHTTKVERKAALQEYKNFPIYILPGSFLNTFSNQLVILLPPLFGMDIEAVGIYSFAGIVLDLMLRLISNAFSPVYLQKAAEVVQLGVQNLGRLSWSLHRNLTFLIFLPTLALYAAGAPLYSFVFGEQWYSAGVVTEWLSLSYFFRLSSSAISPVFAVLRKEKHTLYFQIITFILRVAGLFTAYLLHEDIIGYAKWYSIFNGVAYLLLIAWIFKLLNYAWYRVLGFQILLFGILLTLGWLLKPLFH